MAEGPFKSGCCNLFFEAKVGHAYRIARILRSLISTCSRKTGQRANVGVVLPVATANNGISEKSDELGQELKLKI